MSVRLSLSNLSIFLLLFCCGQNKQYFHTEIFCEKKSYLVRYTRVDEIKKSIELDKEAKKRDGTTENYTLIFASGGRSLKLNISLDDIEKCSFREIPVQSPDKNIIKYSR